jgi:hypothetical protein
MANEDIHPQVRVKVDLSAIPEDEFDAKRTLRVATVRGGKVIDSKDVTPAREKNPRMPEVSLRLGVPEDGVAGADVVVAPADDERNVMSKLTARRFVSATASSVDAVLRVTPSIYRWWRFCWFPHKYHVTGRVVRHEGECTHPVGAANVEVYDVDYCWWWYNQDLLATGTTDADGFFDITFTWCVPLWCLLWPIYPPIFIDPILRDRFRELLRQYVKVPPFPPPPDPRSWERQLQDFGIEVPTTTIRRFQPAPTLRALQTSEATARTAARSTSLTKAKLSAAEIFGPIIFWPPCDNPCDWSPDIKIRVTQNQPTGTVTIYEDSYSDIRWNQTGDILNLTLEANEDALFSDDCRPDPLLGNCMLFERVGEYNVSTIYQPDIGGGFSYGATPDRRQRLGYTVHLDRAWCLTIGVHGDFGLAAGVDYYQVQYASWTPADILAWDADHTHRPADAAFSPLVDPLALGAFTRTYAERVGFFYVWRNEGFAAQTVGGIPGLYKTRQRFEQEYRDSHGGANPAPDFVSGWYWDTWAMTRLFDLDTSRFTNGLYSFRLVGYRQTGVDGSGNPILTLVNMGLPGGVGRRCGGPGITELVTLRLHDNPHVPDCEILDFKKNGATTIDECAIVVLDTTDYITIEYKAEDLSGNLHSYLVTLQRGFDPEQNIRGLGGVTISGTTPQGPDYSSALADAITPAIPPFWNGGTWTATVPAGAFAALGGSCAYNLRLRSWDRQTNGSSSILSAAECERNRAFTVILAADKDQYCDQLGCGNEERQ